MVYSFIVIIVVGMNKENDVVFKLWYFSLHGIASAYILFCLAQKNINYHQNLCITL